MCGHARTHSAGRWLRQREQKDAGKQREISTNLRADPRGQKHDAEPPCCGSRRAHSLEVRRDPPGREPGAPAKLIAMEIGQNENAASCGRRSGQCAARGAVAMDTHHRVADAFLPYLVAMCGLRDSDRQGCWACEATLLFSSARSGGTTNARVPHRRWLQRVMPSRYRRSVQHMIWGKSP